MHLKSISLPPPESSDNIEPGMFNRFLTQWQVHIDSVVGLLLQFLFLSAQKIAPPNVEIRL